MAKRAKSSVAVENEVCHECGDSNPRRSHTCEPKKSIHDKIRDRDYDPKVSYPQKSDFKIVEHVKTERLGVRTIEGFDTEGYNCARSAYASEELRLREQFKNDAFEEAGISDNSKREKCYDLAWEHGHSSGYSEVFNYLNEFAELIKD